jgi:hypothetical protein
MTIRDYDEIEECNSMIEYSFSVPPLSLIRGRVYPLPSCAQGNEVIKRVENTEPRTDTTTKEKKEASKPKHRVRYE